ncbi:MAG: transglutaminase family protein [Verrucomicrobia bacterium]|jgi:transglutaminase-like putative cysteine protease|nr:transglutaminase family protein [Verrucomicrobiota bacterium]
MNYRILHRTTHHYGEPVSVSHHAARLVPRVMTSQQCQSFALRIEPEPAVRQSRRDYFGNEVWFFSIQEVHNRLEVIAESVVSVQEPPPNRLSAPPAWAEVALSLADPATPELVDACQFTFDSPMVGASLELLDYAKPSLGKDLPLLAGVADLCRRIHQDFQFDPKATTVATPLAEVLRMRRGVCQDFAHLALGCLRSAGLAARYVSGYLRTRPPEGQPRLVGVDASHAWIQVFCPTRGWVDFDPTNDLQPGDEHITVAYGRDYSDVSPLSGILTGGGTHEVTVAVDVEGL